MHFSVLTGGSGKGQFRRGVGGACKAERDLEEAGRVAAPGTRAIMWDKLEQAQNYAS